ncbi:MAG TPA: hypothetical protein ENN38_06185 [Actinobacteria bacterium]|nr:hypothetical protein [Actinomycetota bacterium]
MIQENELITLLLWVGLLIFILTGRSRLKRLLSSEILIMGFCAFLAGRILTVLEGFFWGDLLNFLEHGFNAVGSVSLLVWCLRVFGKRGARQRDESCSHF